MNIIQGGGHWRIDNNPYAEGHKIWNAPKPRKATITRRKGKVIKRQDIGETL
jgi:hypothetical protein